jgi:hypothetical protein
MLSYCDTQTGFYSRHFAHIRCPMQSYELIDCFVLLALRNKISCKVAALISMGLATVYFMSVTQSCTCWSTPLGSLTVPHDFSHKISKCQYKSQHQKTERRLQVAISSKRRTPLLTRKTSVWSDNTTFQFT